MAARSSGPFFSGSPVTVPDGIYDGTWGGYVVTMEVDGQRITFATDVGIRTPAAPVTVTVVGGRATVEVVRERQSGR